MNPLAKLAMIAAAATLLLLPCPLAAQRGRGGGAGARGSGAPPMGVPPGNGSQNGIALGPGYAASNPGHGVDRSRATTVIENNPILSQRARTMLPPGSNVRFAAEGFHSETDFLSALHASRNFNVPFEDVKRKMTEGRGMSLDKSIRELRPGMSKDAVKQGVRDAERMAKDDLRTAKGKSIGPSSDEVGAVAAMIRMNHGLSDRVAPLLPENLTLNQASAGFRNTGQFIAALHAARNLGIPFRELRARMIAGGESLGEAIQGVRPAMDRREIDAAVRIAGDSARNDLSAGSAVSANESKRNQ